MTPLTQGVIRDIRERQEAYDRDPERYERMEAAREEERQLEREMEREAERQYYEQLEENQQAEADSYQNDDLPF